MSKGTTNMLLPELDAEIALAEAEEMASLQKDIETGRIDTARLDDIPDGTYTVEILEAGAREAKDKEGNTRYPNMVFRLKAAGDAFTTTIYWPISGAKATARKFFGERLAKTFMRLLGPDFTKVRIEPLKDPAKVLEAKVAYFDALGKLTVGRKAVAVVKTNDDGYKNLDSLNPANVK